MVYINGRFLTQNLSGAQRFAYEIIKGLIQIGGIDLIVLVPPGEINKAYDISKFPVEIIGKRTNLLWEQIDLPLFLNKNKKKLLINLLNTAPLTYRNQVITILDMTTFINPKWFNKWFAYYYRLIVPVIAKISRQIITISQNSKDDILKYINVLDDKINVLYCGVPDQFEEETGGSEQEILAKLNIKKGGFFLSVSSLDPRKNFVELVKAYNDIKEDVYPLIIVGSEGKVFANNELKNIIGNSTKIALTGYLSDIDLTALYQSAYCFIYPSLYEGFGMPPLEAMACGCPTIVSNTSSLPEVCGEASLYIDPYNKESIKNAIVKIMRDNQLRSNLIALGKKQITKFKWSDSSLKLVNIINNLNK